MRRLLIVSSATHYHFGGELYSYGPYTREIDIWADLFPEVLIAAPCRDEAPPGDCLPFMRRNISVVPQKETGGESLRKKIMQILFLPSLILGLCRAMRRADAIHVRCPGNLGLLAIFLAPLFSSRLVAKYAGQWNGYVGEAWTVRLQRKLLASRWWRGPVTVYGRWENQPPHIIPFFTSILTAEQVARGQSSASHKHITAPARVLFVGRLHAGKNVEVLIEALSKLKAQGVTMQCDIVGDGGLRSSLEEQVDRLGVRDLIQFAGGVDFARVLDFYERSHVLVLASESEGFPKAIAEGMAFGLVCVGSDTGLVPQMLGEGKGFVVPPGDAEALARALRRIAESPAEYAQMSARAAAWARDYSLEGLRDAIGELLTKHWRVPISVRLQAEDAQRGVTG